MKDHYAIQVIGYGKHQHFSIRHVVGTLSIPMSRPFRTLQAATEEAKRLELEIAAVGDAYEIL